MELILLLFSIGSDDGPLEQQNQNRNTRRNRTFPLILRENQSPPYNYDDSKNLRMRKEILDM